MPTQTGTYVPGKDLPARFGPDARICQWEGLLFDNQSLWCSAPATAVHVAGVHGYKIYYCAAHMCPACAPIEGN